MQLCRKSVSLFSHSQVAPGTATASIYLHNLPTPMPLTRVQSMGGATQAAGGVADCTKLHAVTVGENWAGATAGCSRGREVVGACPLISEHGGNICCLLLKILQDKSWDRARALDDGKVFDIWEDSASSVFDQVLYYPCRDTYPLLHPLILSGRYARRNSWIGFWHLLGAPPCPET